MADITEIEEFVEKFVKRFEPELVLLFGSHALKTAGPDSDVDLFVIMEFEGRPQYQAYNIRKEIKRTFPLDLIVRRREDVIKRIQMGDLFIKNIMKEGIVLYEKPGS